MNKFVVLVATGALVLFGGCQKQQTEADRNADVEREVQARLTAERQAEEQQRLAQQKGELQERDRALREKEQTADAAARERPAESQPTQVFQAPSSGGESYSIFYTRLEPYGSWVETPTYGYVWQPRAAMDSRSWRPYTSGHWVYTDAGWTWISEEPFGWATYHYGRWTRLRGIGWVWVPGDEWAPAWVSWRTSNDYVGWAPLPPEAHFEVGVGIHNWADNYYDIGPEQYCFVPTREIGTERIERVVVPPEQNLTIVNQTTNVTNITYNNTVVVNQGPNYDELRTRSQRPIQRLRIQRQTSLTGENPRSVVKGEVVEITAPVIARAQAVQRPPVVKQKVTENVVEHGWEGLADQKAAQQARAKIKSEATPPPNAPSKTFVKPAPVAGAPRAASPAPRATAAAITRSTITPALTPAAPVPRATATPPRFSRPAQTPAMVGTPALPAAQAGVPQPTASPALTATQQPRTTATPLPIGTPMATPRPAFSPGSSPQPVSPTTTTTPPSPPFGRAETKEQRRAEKEMRKQEQAERKRERFQAATPTPAATAMTPTLAASPVETPRLGKEHKKHKRSGEQEASPTATPPASP
jgi:hypothetical protein